MEQNLELRKVRDFGELISDTVVFAMQNWKPLLKAYASICGFFVVAAGIMAILQQSRVTKIFNSGEIPKSPFSIYGWDTVLNMLLLLLLGISMTITIFSYISLYREKGNVPPTVEEVWSYFKYFFWRLLGAQILLYLLLCVGICLCIVPGIYLMPVMMIISAVMVFENASLGYSFDRGFKLIKNQWWATFGAMFIILIIVYAASMVVILPVSIATGAGMIFGNFKMSLPLIILTTILQYLCQAFCILVDVVIALAYFSLVERKEGAGLSERISSIGNHDPSADLPEEQY